ncbi:MAG: hypothetical protein CFH21_00198 [Alphaproteobacteria bacterium MarineAlpha5_Bin11]|nr:hypothetical protein [Pelagibacteraceae bacterium]PPR44796.1 MAG: hypothetical protein CFH21_00198 [Alphaproteobacteria bacterium MarineAlpha5_Bin11]PPR50221.1 MAG: hypothetical protein CFH20_00961 [Alphaproteobacteria bacterium MarineAlpha5_Bin10]|tara:strand:- start:4849 stop:5199 length:351 start_codon:yes stop_codon:yes gene_type:complete
MTYLIIKTIITAIVIVAVSEIAKKSSLLAGLLASIPLTSFLAFIWLYWETNDSQKVIDLSNSILLMIVPSLTFFIILPLALKLNIPFFYSIIFSVFITGIIYWIYIILLNRFNLNI